MGSNSFKLIIILMLFSCNQRIDESVHKENQNKKVDESFQKQDEKLNLESYFDFEKLSVEAKKELANDY